MSISEDYYLDDFSGTLVSSPSKRFKIAFGIYLDARDTVSRHFILLSVDQVISRGKVAQEIDSASIDDSGHFGLYLRSTTKSEQSTIFFFDHHGIQYTSVAVPRIIDFFTILDGGNQVLLAYNSKIILLQLVPVWTLVEFSLPSRFYAQFGFVDCEDAIVLTDQHGASFRFSMTGVFKDYDLWIQHFLSHADGPQIYHLFRDLCKDADTWSPTDFHSAALWIQEALSRGIEESLQLKTSSVHQFLAYLFTKSGQQDAASAAQLAAKESMDGFRVIDSIYERLEDVIARAESGELLQEIKHLNKAEAYPRILEYPNYAGRLFRCKGELLEAAKEIEAAIQSYKQALDINPKVGCKKRLDRLQNSIQG